jgi:hypothetical protein
LPQTKKKNIQDFQNQRYVDIFMYQREKKRERERKGERGRARKRERESECKSERKRMKKRKRNREREHKSVGNYISKPPGHSEKSVNYTVLYMKDRYGM